VVLGGLLLDAAFALTSTAWTVWLLAVTLGACAMAFARDASDRATVQAASEHDRPLATRRRRIRTRQVAAVVLALLPLGGAVVLTAVTADDAYDKPLVQLSVLPTSAEESRLRIAVNNNSDTVSRLIVRLEPDTRHDSIVVTLRPSQTWTRTVHAPRHQFVATLRRPGEQQHFAHVTWSRAG
jgi:hypothetical protein